MFAMRCTRALLTRLKASPDPSPPASTTKLGNWYANLLYTKPQQLILCVSERTLLPVIMTAKGAEPTGVRLAAGVGEMLRALGIPETAIEAELAAMSEVTISTTASRSVLGSMNDFAFMLDTHLRYGDSFSDAALKLADAPCSPIAMMSPKRATLKMLGGLRTP
jgi:hypothetical protein